MTTTIIVGLDGVVSTLGDVQALSALGAVRRRRVGRIEPVHRVKRGLFRLVRAAAGENGRLAAWTRSWRGPWKATVLATGETYEAQGRQACEAWEQARVQESMS